jgi:hypothetical protein
MPISPIEPSQLSASYEEGTVEKQDDLEDLAN